MSNDNTPQIFQTDKPTRWKSVKWTLRVLLQISIFFIAVLGIALYSGSTPSLPNLEAKAREYQTTLDPSNPLVLRNNQNARYKGFKDFLFKKLKADSLRKARNHGRSKANDLSLIRAVFYTPWNARVSLPDLEKNADKINTIFPEWFFIDTISYRLQTRIDSAGLALMQQKKLRIMPMLTNFNSSKNDFDGKLLHHLLKDSVAINSFIQQLADTLSFYHLSGINIDFEELKEKSNEPLTFFQKRLYEVLHAKNMLVSMDVEPKNEDYDYRKLSLYNDYIILMAYDEFNGSTGPGPISAQKWIEDAVSWAAERIDPSKIIMGVAGFGYSWSDGKIDPEPLTYNDAINKAKSIQAKIIYDNDTYNLHYNYITQDSEDTTDKVYHEVWFTDAATTFNVLRFSDEFPTAGTALWRLGSEDQRIWRFYNRNLGNASLQQHPFNFDSLKTIPVIQNNVGFQGEGEVLDIIYSPQPGKIDFEIDSSEQLIAEQNYIQFPSGYVIRKFAEDTTVGKGHKLILTFDDGPSAEWTPQIINILEREKVPATFFVIGINAEQNIPILKREYRDGFEIGNHTFTHHNIAEMSLSRAALEMKLTRLLIESVTGHSTILFRAPYNADSEPQTYDELAPIQRSRTENYLTINESIDPNDWAPGVTADSIFQRVITQVETGNASIILLHDAGGDTRKATVEALPRIIDYFKKKGYVFTSVADLMGKTRDEVMPKVANSRDKWTRKFNFFLAETTYWSGQIVFTLFIIGILLSVVRMLAMAILASIQKKKDKESAANTFPAFLLSRANEPPLVSVIVPAYNEEVNAIRTVNSLLAQDYSQLEIIFVDDGSKDKTFLKVNDFFKNNSSVKVYTKVNGGKASALNFGIQKSNADYVVCIDADTQLKPDAVSFLMKKFDNENVGAVAGNVKVGNEINMITRWQSIEYITSQNFDRRAFDLLNCITVIPGAIGAFRKDAILIGGRFTTDTLAEDCDLTMRLLRSGYIVKNCIEAISYTEAPETFRQFLKQRFRWSFGVMQCFWKHRDTIFNSKYKNFGMVAMPNILIYQILIPILAPLADIILLLSLLMASLGIVVASIPHIILYYIIFTLVDIAGAALAFAYEKENPLKLIWMIPQRLVYRQMMYYILIKSISKAIKGELQGWGALKRTGSVKEAFIHLGK
jgi:cellulose synthase/poly-beta-1,6-N-acetylglucosamine synthase-like glycosyltransferase/spore germination protein YaaH/peptidoglycan/xylan/chitin deacetylase (PgdA/CDA1 family)